MTCYLFWFKYKSCINHSVINSTYNYRKKPDSPFESKPKLARNNSVERKPPESHALDSNRNETGKTVVRVDYNPASGVTFRENRTSDVQVVGKGYNDEPNETKPVIMGFNGRRRRVQPKGRQRNIVNVWLLCHVYNFHMYFCVWFDPKALFFLLNNFNIVLKLRLFE